MNETLTLLGTIIAAFIGAIAGPFIIFKYKKKYEAFFIAVRALINLYTEATDIRKSQSKYPSRDDLSKGTTGLIIKANDLVMTHFTTKAYNLFDAAIKAPISRDNAPNEDFENKKRKAINRMKRELVLHWIPNILITFLCLVILFYFGNLLLSFISFY